MGMDRREGIDPMSIAQSLHLYQRGEVKTPFGRGPHHGQLVNAKYKCPVPLCLKRERDLKSRLSTFGVTTSFDRGSGRWTSPDAQPCASVRLDIRKTGTVKNGEQVVGNNTRVKVVKNKRLGCLRW